MEPRLIVDDVEAGLAAGFVMFMGRYSDFHLIKLFRRRSARRPYDPGLGRELRLGLIA